MRVLVFHLIIIIYYIINSEMKNFNLIIVGLGSIGGNLAKYLIKQNYKIRVWDKN